MVDGRMATYFMVGVFSPNEVKNQERVLTANTPTRPKLDYVSAEGENLSENLAQEKVKDETDNETKDDHATITEDVAMTRLRCYRTDL